MLSHELGEIVHMVIHPLMEANCDAVFLLGGTNPVIHPDLIHMRLPYYLYYVRPTLVYFYPLIITPFLYLSTCLIQ